MKVKCCYCGKEFEASAGSYHRAIKKGLNVYCNRKCAGFGRRTGRTKEQDKLIKYFYDRLIWLSDDGTLKKKKHEAFLKDYKENPEKYRKERQRKMKAHVEYCRQPEYKKYKQKYDQQHRSKRLYGEYWESAIALRELANIVDNRTAKYQQGNTNKSQKRKRNAKKYIKRKELEICSLGLH